MKAVLCKQFGPPETLVVEDVVGPDAGVGEVVVSVHAAAVNFPDTLIIENRYQFKPALPFSPGGEVSGVVKSVGPQVVGFAAGDRVIAVCGWGGFAEEVVVPVRKLVHLPEGVAMDMAALLMLTYGTSYYALKDRAQIQPGETLLVLGAAGGAGLSAVELGKAMGARVIAAASSDRKLALCLEHGADHTINYATADIRESLRDLTGGRGVDVVYDPVGGSYTEPALRSMAWNGRLLVIGFTAGEIPRLPLNLPLLKGCSIVGVFYGAFLEREPERYRLLMSELMQLLATEKIHPAISARLPIEQAAEALREVADRRAMGKIILTTALGRLSLRER
jgi:NADPH2:quinone reductase